MSVHAKNSLLSLTSTIILFLYFNVSCCTCCGVSNLIIIIKLIERYVSRAIYGIGPLYAWVCEGYEGGIWGCIDS